jgi:hypothetical protein
MDDSTVSSNSSLRSPLERWSEVKTAAPSETVCSRCGQHVKLLGFEEHRKHCTPTWAHDDCFVDNYGLTCRLDAKTDEVFYDCKHSVYQGSLRNVWEKQSVWHTENEAVHCRFFTIRQRLKRKFADEEARVKELVEALP